MMKSVQISIMPVIPAENRALRDRGARALVVAVMLSTLSIGEGLRLTGP